MKNIRPILLFLCLSFVACSPKVRVDLLTFFFDGVPDADTSISTRSADSMQAVAMAYENAVPDTNIIPLVVYHEPYKKKLCMSCHDQNAVGDLIMSEPELCYSCHEDYNNKYKFLHGPVSAGFCSTCHKPHMSATENLLTSEGNSLCFPCHVTYEIKQPSSHVEIGNAACSECHNPHGENDKPRRRISIEH